MIKCRVLGPLEIRSTIGDEIDIKGNKNRALLVYLARSPRLTRGREHLTGLLWGDKPEDKARHSLREAVRVLRKQLGDRVLEGDGDQLRIAPEMVRLDLEELEEAEQAKNWEKAADVVAGEFLEGLSIKGEWGFEDWLAAERAFWRGRCALALSKRCEDLLAAGSASEAVELAMRAQALDSTSGIAVRAAMKSLVLSGDRSQALVQYDFHLKRLSDLGSEPEPETKQLAHQVRLERSWRLPGSVKTSKGAASRRAPLVGRSTALASLVDCFEKSQYESTATVCLIEGDSGTGKTRLAEELQARARLTGATVASFRAVAGDVDLPETGLLGLARSGLQDASGLAAASPNSLAAFAAEIPEWADRFGMPKKKTPPLESAIIDILRAITLEQTAALLVDDAQWCDPATLLALTATLRDLEDSPINICFSFAQLPQRDELDELRSRIGRDLTGTTTCLGPLDDSALTDLAAWALPDYTADEVDRLARRVASDSAGLPLLAVELLHAVALGMDLDATAGAWPRPLRTLSQTLPGDLPDAIVGAIRVGFRRLTKNAQTVLAAASVLESPVSTVVLSKTSKLGDDKLHAALDELEWQRWLAADVRGYSFVARIVQQVVSRDMITDGQKHRILDAAEWP